MTTLQITGNVRNIPPTSIPHWFAKVGTTDLANLKTITDAFPVPAYVLAGGGTIGSRRSLLGDDDIELCVRDWIYRNCYMTGVDETTSPPLASSQRALTVYNWMQTNIAHNGGHGPTISCGTSSSVYIGMLAAYGIPSRKVQGLTQVGDADQTAEYWSSTKGGWVHTIPHSNQHFESPSGVKLSLLEWGLEDRNRNQLLCPTGSYTEYIAARITNGTFHAVYLDGGNGTNLYGGATAHDWAGYAYGAGWQRGNVSNCSAGNSEHFVTLAPTRTMADGQVARHLNDIDFTLNCLEAETEIQPSGFCLVQLIPSMLDTGSTPQVYRPAGSGWETIEASVNGLNNLSYGFFPKNGDVWKLRMLGPLGNTSNVVIITVTA